MANIPITDTLGLNGDLSIRDDTSAAFVHGWGEALIRGGLMDREDILLQIDAEIARLQQAKALLTGVTVSKSRNPSRPSGAGIPGNARRTLSAEAREKIAAAQRSRWAKSKRAAKKAARESHAESAVKKAKAAELPKKQAKKRTLSAGARAKIAAAQRVRWAKTRRGKRTIPQNLRRSLLELLGLSLPRGQARRRPPLPPSHLLWPRQRKP